MTAFELTASFFHARGPVNHLKPLTAIVFRCPYCRHTGSFTEGWGDGEIPSQVAVKTGDRGNRAIRAYIGDTMQVSAFFGSRICPNRSCRGHVFLIHDLEKALFTYPPETIDFDSAGMPAKVLKAFEESIVCHANRAYVAAAMLVRKTLEEICLDRGAQGKNLNERIGDLASKIVVPEALVQAMHNVRLLGNDAAHVESQAFDNVGKEEVEAAIALTKALVQATYQYDTLIAKLTSLKK